MMRSRYISLNYSTLARMNLPAILLISTLVLVQVQNERAYVSAATEPTFASGALTTSTSEKSSQDDTLSATLEPDIKVLTKPNEPTTVPNQQVTANTPVDPGKPVETREPEGVTTSASGESDEVVRCVDDSYCLNGGTCTLLKNGQMRCICPDDFYGTRCQTKNVCKTIIAENLTGDQLCAKLGYSCMENDRYFRCQCDKDEYFVFKLIPKPATDYSSDTDRANSKFPHTKNSKKTISYFTNIDKTLPKVEHSEGNSLKEGHESSYLAECRKIDKCLGIRCRRMSEVCLDGVCECNLDLGYIRDAKDGICKLLDPCTQPRPEGEPPICGQARCIATYDRELYKCFCPLGYKALKVGIHRSSTQCTLMTDDICLTPLLNKCQHICSVDQENNRYKCSCFPGYRSGDRVGIDDHMCFFNELGYPSPSESHVVPKFSGNNDLGHLYKAFLRSTSAKIDSTDDKIIYDEAHQESNHNTMTGHDFQHDHRDDDKYSKTKPREIVIKRGRLISNLHSSKNSSRHDDEFDEYGLVQSKMNAQERCNMFCELNKICVLESGSLDSYRCICDRQGFVSVGDSCLDWCSAATFSYRVRGYLERTCYTGVCGPTGERPNPRNISDSRDELLKIESLSSWRPTFECDCNTRPFLEKDASTGLCKLNFKAVLEPCLPGNNGYEDCVINNTAYCSVLHKPLWSMLNPVPFDRSMDMFLGNNMKTSSSDAIVSAPNKQKSEKFYTCVCSPEKKFLVDKPRKKSKCIDECNLLNEECNSFNRMCRSATIGPKEFGVENLVRFSQEGSRLNIRRTGCECLPGFDVGPYETVDFTVDDSIPDTPATQVPLVENDFDRPNMVGPGVSDHLRAKYMNIDSRCLLDYDVVEFHASFRAPTDFDPIWIDLKNAVWINPFRPEREPIKIGHIDYDKEDDPKDTPSNPATEKEKTKADRHDLFENYLNADGTLKIPRYMLADAGQLHEEVVLVAQCDQSWATLSPEAYQECIRYRYWLFQKLRNHFVDWRRVLTEHLSQTFDLMDGRIKVRVNKCHAILKGAERGHTRKLRQADPSEFVSFDPINQQAIVDADVNCVLTLHSAREDPQPKSPRKVLLEKQLVKFIFNKPEQFGNEYYLMAPNILIHRESFDQLAEHRKLFNPCKSNYNYCDKQTKCEMVDTVNFTCTCDVGYTPIGSRDIYYGDSRKETCTDIDECLFDVCKELANRSTCINEIGDYRCECKRHFVGDNKRYCEPVCSTVPCKHGNCRLIGDHHAFCECHEGYKEADCSVQDPNVALRKANMIICGSILTSVLLLAITFAISLNSKLRKTKKKLKRLESAFDSARLAEFTQQQAPFRPRLSKNSTSD